MLRRNVQACVTLVPKVRILEVRGVVAHDALHKIEVVEQDRTAQTPRYVNPVTRLSARCSSPFTAARGGRTCREVRSMAVGAMHEV